MKKHTIAALAASIVTTLSAHAGFLDGRTVSGIYSLALDAGPVSGLEASAVTYARDRGTLFFVGDEGTGVVEISKTGQTIGSMSFNWSGTTSTNHDTEGLTYLGNGVLVVGEERLYDAYKFNYQAGGTATLSNSQVSISNASVGNNGMEGISYDPRNGGSFVTIKQVSPEDILAGNLTFGSGTTGTSTMTQLFNPALLGLSSLSDVQTLSVVDSLVGTAQADNLLILSLDSRKLVETNRAGQIQSVLDLTNILAHNAIEGVTVDELGNIYLVAEQIQDGTGGLDEPSKLIVLAALPEPGTALFGMLALGAVGVFSRRRTATVATAC